MVIKGYTNKIELNYLPLIFHQTDMINDIPLDASVPSAERQGAV